MEGTVAHAGPIRSECQLTKMTRPVSAQIVGRRQNRNALHGSGANQSAAVQDAEAYPRLLDVAASADAAEGIRQGVEDAKKGRIRPAKEFFGELEARHGLSHRFR